jgi:hypothetical protein
MREMPPFNDERNGRSVVRTYGGTLGDRVRQRDVRCGCETLVERGRTRMKRQEGQSAPAQREYRKKNVTHKLI